MFQTEPFFMFFTPDPASPIAKGMAEFYELVSMTMKSHDLGGLT